MLNIIVLHYKLQKKFQTIHSIANIYQYKVENIVLLISTLCMPHKNIMSIFNFPSYYYYYCYFI